MNQKRELLRDLGFTGRGGPEAPSRETVRRAVLTEIGSASPERKGTSMKAIRKTILIAAAAALVLSVAAFAAGSAFLRWEGRSSSVPAYTVLPAAEQCVADAGFAPTLLERFENGYTFRDGQFVDNTLYGDGDEVLESFRSFSFDYEKDGDVVILDQEKYASDTGEYGEVITDVDGTEVYYFRYNSRSVAPDYVLTPEEAAAQAAGELVFSYGVDIPGVQVVQSVHWTVGDMHYSLMQIDGALTAQELAAMAAEVIRAA